MPAMVYFTNELVDAESNVSAQTLIAGVASGIGRVIGNMVGGTLIDVGGTQLMLLVTVAVMAVGILLMFTTMGMLHKRGMHIR